MTLKLAVAGVAHPHIETIMAETKTRDDVDLVGIAEPDDVLRETFAARYGVAGFTSHTDLLDHGVDIVAVGDVFGRRGRVVADALRAGAHVISDKPLCTTRADLDTIHHEWRRGDALLSVAFEKRFLPPTLAAAQLIETGELGDLALVTATGPHKLLRAQRPGWMFAAATYGGILNDLVVHDIDLLLQFTSARRGQVTGYAHNYGTSDEPEFEDAGLAVIHVDDGPIASLDAHWFNPDAAPYHGDYRMRLVGTEGTADLLWKDNNLIVATHRDPPRSVPLPPRQRPAEDFFNAVVNGTTPAVSGTDALAATSIALAAQESAREQRPVAWDVGRFTHE